MAKFRIVVTAWEEQVHEVEADSEAEALAQVKENCADGDCGISGNFDCGLDFGDPNKIDE